MALIEGRGLRKIFKTTVALDGIDLTVEQGRILGIIGPTAPVRRRSSMPYLVSPHAKVN